MRIAVDAMGGDRGPEIVAKAANDVAAADPENLEIVLVGDKQRVENVLRKSGRHPNIEVVHASETIDMHEAPATAIRKKKDSSIAVAIQLVKEGKADGLVSAGNTGAVVAGSLVTLGRLHGVSRPAITTFYPTSKRWSVLLDVGANSECTPKNLLQFGVMGSVFAESQLGVKNPRVGLLNIGEESSKGNKLVVEAHQQLVDSGINFIGNVEGRDVFAGAADVVVCDGFVGNVVLKFSESILSFISGIVRREIKASFRARLGALMMKGVFAAFRSQMDYAELGGAPLLGVNGVVIISHGKSNVRAIRNAITMAQRLVNYDINRHIEERFKKAVNDFAKVS